MSIKRKRALKIGGIALAALLAVFSVVSLVAVQMLFDDTFARTAPPRPGDNLTEEKKQLREKRSFSRSCLIHRQNGVLPKKFF